MSFALQLQVVNRGSQPLRTIVYGGTIFEVLDPYSRVQSLSVVEDTTIVVPPGQTQLIEVPAFCLNQNFAPPRGAAMRPTSLALQRQFRDQQALWTDLRQRQ